MSVTDAACVLLLLTAVLLLRPCPVCQLPPHRALFPPPRSLISCFRELPSITAQHQHHQHQHRHQRHAAAAAAAGPSQTPDCRLLDVPREVLYGVMARLEPLDFARLCCCCRDLNAAGGVAVPAVKLTLFPHQARDTRSHWRTSRAHAVLSSSPSPAGTQPPYADPSHLFLAPTQYHRPQVSAVRWMQARERRGGPQPRHPTLLRLPTAESRLPLWADVTSAELSTEPPPMPPDVRGGFFCDEPVGCVHGWFRGVDDPAYLEPACIAAAGRKRQT